MRKQKEWMTLVKLLCTLLIFGVLCSGATMSVMAEKGRPATASNARRAEDAEPEEFFDEDGYLKDGMIDPDHDKATGSNAEKEIPDGRIEAEIKMPEKKEQDPGEVILGVWEADEITGYRFEEDGTGALLLPGEEYPFVYSLEGNMLSLNFESEKAEDAVFRITAEEDELVMTISGSDTEFLFRR